MTILPPTFSEAGNVFSYVSVTIKMINPEWFDEELATDHWHNGHKSTGWIMAVQVGPTLAVQQLSQIPT